MYCILYCTTSIMKCYNRLYMWKNKVLGFKKIAFEILTTHSFKADQVWNLPFAVAHGPDPTEQSYAYAFVMSRSPRPLGLQNFGFVRAFLKEEKHKGPCMHQARRQLASSFFACGLISLMKAKRIVCVRPVLRFARRATRRMFRSVVLLLPSFILLKTAVYHCACRPCMLVGLTHCPKMCFQLD